MPNFFTDNVKKATKLADAAATIFNTAYSKLTQANDLLTAEAANHQDIMLTALAKKNHCEYQIQKNTEFMSKLEPFTFGM